MNKQYIKGSLGMYFNFFILGMVNIIFTLNMDSLTEKFNTNAGGISLLLSGFGIGKLLTYALTGYLSDRFGRKFIVATGSILMAVFLFAFPFAPNYQFGFALSILMGIANSALDSGTYPALTESHPKAASLANVTAKMFNSVGAMLLPILITFLVTNNLGYQLSFYIPGIGAILALILIITSRFPDHKANTQEESADVESIFNSKPIFWLEGVALIVIGFTSLALIMVAPVWLPTLAQNVINMTSTQAVTMLTAYNAGAFASIILLIVVLKKISSLNILIVYPVLTIAGYLLLLSTQSTVIAFVGAFIVGLSISGVLQLAITTITQFFPENKGTMTGIISTSGSIAAITMPALSGFMFESIGIQSVIWLQIAVAAIGILAAIIVKYRYNMLTKEITSTVLNEVNA